MGESGELVFLRYAFPATDCCSHGNVNEREKAQFIKFLREGGTPDRARLEELFPNAAKHLKSWGEMDVRDYWCAGHNKVVADNPVCKVYGLKVAQVHPGRGEEVCRVNIGGNGDYPSYIALSPGDFFTVHNLIVAEQLSRDDYFRYFANGKR